MAEQTNKRLGQENEMLRINLRIMTDDRDVWRTTARAHGEALRLAELEREILRYAVNHNWTRGQLDWAIRTVNESGHTPSPEAFAALATH